MYHGPSVGECPCGHRGSQTSMQGVGNVSNISRSRSIPQWHFFFFSSAEDDVSFVMCLERDRERERPPRPGTGEATTEDGRLLSSLTLFPHTSLPFTYYTGIYVATHTLNLRYDGLTSTAYEQQMRTLPSSSSSSSSTSLVNITDCVNMRENRRC